MKTTKVRRLSQNLWRYKVLVWRKKIYPCSTRVLRKVWIGAKFLMQSDYNVLISVLRITLVKYEISAYIMNYGPMKNAYCTGTRVFFGI